LIVRPDVDHRFSNYDHPGILESLMEALGAEVVDYPMRTQCCSGHMPQINGDVAFEMIHRLVHGAADRSADLIVTLCPMCQLNLDAYQPGMNRQYHTNDQMPVLYFTQLMGLAFGLPAKSLGIGEEVVPAGPALAKIGQEAAAVEPAAEQAPRKPRKDEGLPMPLMSESFAGHEEVR
jgi:heterodisulfide reductase subunit B